MFIKKLLPCIVLFIISSCASSQVANSEKNKLSDVKHYQLAPYQGSYLTISSYSFEKKEQSLPAGYQVNGIVFRNLDDQTLSVVPGEYNIKAFFVGKQPTEITVTAGSRDSVIVKLYLQESTEPLHQN